KMLFRGGEKEERCGAIRKRALQLFDGSDLLAHVGSIGRLCDSALHFVLLLGASHVRRDAQQSKRSDRKLQQTATHDQRLDVSGRHSSSPKRRLLDEMNLSGETILRRGGLEPAVRNVLSTKMTLCAAPPGAHEGVIQSAADRRAGQGNQAARPFFSGFRAHLGCQSASDARSDAFKDLLLGEILAEIDACSGGRGFPHFHALFGVMHAKSIEQTQALNEAQRDDHEQTGVRNQRKHSSETKAETLGESELRSVAD